MMQGDVLYESDVKFLGDFDVVFINKNGVSLVKRFDSPYLSEQFVNKCKRSKNVTLVTYPTYK